MSTLLQDLRYGVRMLTKKPGFTFIAVLILYVAIRVAGPAAGKFL